MRATTAKEYEEEQDDDLGVVAERFKQELEAKRFKTEQATQDIGGHSREGAEAEKRESMEVKRGMEAKQED